MGKKKDKNEQPAYLAELLTEGTATISAGTLEELAEMVNDIPADCSYVAGAVGRNAELGLFTLRIDLNKQQL